MKIKLFLLMIIIIASSTAISAPGPTSIPTTIEIHPSEIKVKAGDIFNISLIVKPFETINTVATDLIYWTPGTLECLSTEQGNLFPDEVFYFKGTINNKEGKITKFLWSSKDATNTTGVYANLTFRALQGTTDIVIDAEEFGIANAGVAIDRDILNSCHVEVQGEADPNTYEPDNNELKPGGFDLGVWFIFILFILLIVRVVAIFYTQRKKIKKSSKQQHKKENKGEEDVEGKVDDLFS